MSRKIIGALILGAICWAEYALIGGINGLTIFAVPITMYLGLHVLEKLDEQEENGNETTKEQNN